jgi:FkbM family methyltransferase
VPACRQTGDGSAMTIVSYAQNFEDVILWRALKQVKDGFYIDIGAQDPVVDSVSLAFYEQGWRGVHVEPIAQYAERLRSARPDEQVVEAAIGRQEGTIQFHEIVNTGLSTGNKAIALAHEQDGRITKRLEVACVPLSDILDAHKDREIHWLKIDVEGMEGQVIASWSPSPVRPWIVLVESTTPSSSEPSFAGWEPGLIALGYQFVYFDGLNRFYVSAHHPELKASFGAGPNLFDGFVLSPTAPFCSKLNADMSALRQQLTQRADEVARLSQFLDTARAEGAAQGAALARATNAWESLSATREAEIVRLNARIVEMDRRGQAALSREVALKQQVAALSGSTSWRVAAPLPFVSRNARWLARGTWAWMTLKPGSRPRRAARRISLGLANRIIAWPRGAAFTKRLLSHFPALKDRLRAMVHAQRRKNFEAVAVSGPQKTKPLLIDSLDLSAESEGVRRLYLRLVQTRERASRSRDWI